FVISPSPLFASPQRPPLASTLFPYTTLFRSEFDGDDEAIDALTETAVEDPDGLLHVASRIRQDRERQAQYEQLVAEHEAAGVTIDRKSTRLNSSHVKISYAVFCLKKQMGQRT